MDNPINLFNNITQRNETEQTINLNVNYDLIKQELEIVSDKIVLIQGKNFFYKNDGTVLFAIEDTETNVISILYKLDERAHLNILPNRVSVLTIAKNFLAFNRNKETGNLLCSPMDAAFLRLNMPKGIYQKIIECSIITGNRSRILTQFFNENPNVEDKLDIIYHNSTDGYICKIGNIELSVKRILGPNGEIGLNILSINDESSDLGKVECPVYKYYKKKKVSDISHGRHHGRSISHMKDSNFDEYSFSTNIKGKYDNFFNNRIFK